MRNSIFENKKPIDKNQWVLKLLADRTGLEPATSSVTGMHSNQLNYRSIILKNNYFLFSKGVQIYSLFDFCKMQMKVFQLLRKSYFSILL